MGTSIVRAYNIKGNFEGYAIWQSTSCILSESHRTIKRTLEDAWDEKLKQYLTEQYPDNKCSMNNAIRCPKCTISNLWQFEGEPYWSCSHCDAEIPNSEVHVEPDFRSSP